MWRFAHAVKNEESNNIFVIKLLTRKSNRKAQTNVLPQSFLSVFYMMINALDKPVWTGVGVILR